MIKKEANRTQKENKQSKIDFVKWLSELDKTSGKIAGGKGANLAEMYNAKFPVPPAFIITAQAYIYFLETSGIKDEIDEIVKSIDIDNTAELEQKSEKIRKIITEAEMPSDLKNEIIEAYENLDVDIDLNISKVAKDALSILKTSYEPVFVAVRSSATTEDLSTASFAGQQESFLNVKGKEQLIEKVKKCFASLFTARAVYYRKKKGFSDEESALAVVIQRMIDSDKSGVIFTNDPLTKKDNIVIEAVFGLGEGIVSGQIKPDNYLVSRDLEILKEDISVKNIAITRNAAGENIKVKLTEEKARQKVLTNAEIKQLGNISIKIEEHYKKPQDIEFAIETGKIYIVQSRPITTLETKHEKKEIQGKVLVQGLAASPGIGSGKVKIVSDLRHLDKVKKGDILVTEMTNPDMVVTMQRASGIVTNEGGQTCIEGDARILTNRGFIKMRDINEKLKEGLLYTLSIDSKTRRSRWKKIIRTYSRKTKAKKIALFLHPTGKLNDTLNITNDHEILFLNGTDLIKKRLEEFLLFDNKLLTLTKIPSLNLNFQLGVFDKFKLMYLTGAFLSDGHIVKRKSGKPMRLKFSQRDTDEKIEFISTVRNYFSELFGANLVNYVKKGTTITRNGRQNLRALSFDCSRALPAQIISKIRDNIVNIILSLSESEIIPFLAGFIDGDGHFNKEKKHIEIYIDRKTEDIKQAILISCLKLGIAPKVRRKKFIDCIILSNNINQILNFCKRVKGYQKKVEDYKLFSTKQLLVPLNIVDWRGNLWNYIKKDRLIGIHWLLNYLNKKIDEKLFIELEKIRNSDLSTIKVKPICDEEVDVFNIEVEADNELDHNYVVFSKNNYTPIVVGNCHAAIVSREMGIPAVVGTRNATKILRDEQEVTVDGYNGKVYQGKGEAREVEILPMIKTKTKIKISVDLPDFAERAAKSKAREVGLVRIEGIIASSGIHPLQFLKENKISEYEKLLEKGISEIAKHFDEIWIRSSDIRSDEYRHLKGSPEKPEFNPMLGMHGIRTSLKQGKLFEAELLAMKKVADRGKIIGVMFPQVISVEEVQKAREIAKKLGILNNKNMKFGVMIETPAAVQVIEDICKEKIDFISFGTNDLTQFTLAIDRGNEDVQYLYNEMNPAVLSQLAHVIKICRKYDVETSICGQAANKKEMVEFLIKHGIDGLSVNPDSAYEISKFVKELEVQGKVGIELEKEEEEFEEQEEAEKVEEREKIKRIEKAEKSELIGDDIEIIGIEKEKEEETESREEKIEQTNQAEKALHELFGDNEPKILIETETIIDFDMLERLAKEESKPTEQQYKAEKNGAEEIVKEAETAEEIVEEVKEKKAGKTEEEKLDIF